MWEESDLHQPDQAEIQKKYNSSEHPYFYLVYLSYLYFYSILLFMCLLEIFDITFTFTFTFSHLADAFIQFYIK